jgi:enoyl-CoA hydratase/carnithine racemase
VRNALNIGVRRKLAEAFRSLADAEQVRAIVLTGAHQVFCAGADLREFVEATPVEMLRRHSERLWKAIADAPQPIIAAVNGVALGGGMELAMNADIIVAGRSARFGQPEVKMGIMPGAGGITRLTRAVGKFQAMRICLTGDLLDAESAFRAGLVSEVVEDAQVLDRAAAIARAIAALPPLAIQQIKRAIVLSEDSSLEAGLMLEQNAMHVLFASADKREAMTAFLEKRKPSFRGE